MSSNNNKTEEWHFLLKENHRKREKIRVKFASSENISQEEELEMRKCLEDLDNFEYDLRNTPQEHDARIVIDLTLHEENPKAGGKSSRFDDFDLEVLPPEKSPRIKSEANTCRHCYMRLIVEKSTKEKREFVTCPYSAIRDDEGNRILDSFGKTVYDKRHTFSWK
jgi:D-alanyl-D-alanine dipeptidase